jgi:hypothetical protein
MYLGVREILQGGGILESLPNFFETNSKII